MKAVRFATLSAFLSLAFASPGSASRSGAWRVIPSPQYFEVLQGRIMLSGASDIQIVTGTDTDPKTSLAAGILKDTLEKTVIMPLTNQSKWVILSLCSV